MSRKRSATTGWRFDLSFNYPHQKRRLLVTKRILITGPSLNVADNVSGISSLVANILKYSRTDVHHFELGSRDNEKKNIFWFLKQVIIFIKFFLICAFKKYTILHVNTGLEKFSIIRDCLIVFIAKKIFNKKVLLHLHGGYYLMNEVKGGLVKSCLVSLVKNANEIIVLSEKEEKILSKRYLVNKFNILPNSIDESRIVERNCARGTNSFKLIFLGRVNKTKGLEIIADSFNYLKDDLQKLKLEIYGAGPDLSEWLKMLKNYPRLNHEYRGVIEGRAKWEMLSKSDIFLLPSLHSEGLPIAMLEAMASGCIVIVTDDASITTVVEDNVTGLVIPKNSPQLLAGKIRGIIENKIDVYKIRKNAQDLVKSKFGFSKYVTSLDGIYANLK